ncbi:SDR family NAD(P)-dependent oxidoreductase [Cellulosilyticum sp. I15G10I2]|uniref:SDR family NAD(P)-dependent oxidoreductase n=1 Tax=Cellulosilyticum sp. I15G10I2 TaxID=1892843 RepID=UPI00085C23C6|nr:SDR family NAD(P)-dependent oxidoreductase [Cellulosilyticum sp. I15G10I2]
MILEKNNYDKNALKNKIVLITGGGGGIGIEASRAFAYMGAHVIIAEIDAGRGKQAQKLINAEDLNGIVDFFQIDITDERQIDKLYKYIMDKYTRLDVLINNAAIVPMGAIDTVSISDWDLSYAVNLRAPVLLTKKFISSMKDTGGIIVFVPSAAPTPYMSAYEIFKTAQMEFCNTLCEEIEGTGIITYSIAPGFVKTDTAVKAVEIVAFSLGITTEEFYKSLEELITDAEIAGVGYAVSVVMAKQYNGKEIMSYQVLMDSGLISNDKEKSNSMQTQVDFDNLSFLFKSLADVFFDQYQNWQKKKLFQKQFIFSDFKKQMGLPAENFKIQIEALQGQINNNEWGNFLDSKKMFIKWRCYYEHQIKLLQGYEKNAAQLRSDTKLLNSWIENLQEIIKIL